MFANVDSEMDAHAWLVERFHKIAGAPKAGFVLDPADSR
jgi:hypothetical protein